MSDMLNIAISGINAAQVALNTIGNNITNASTPGYTRESTVISNALPQQDGAYSQGNGATVVGVVRQASTFLNNQLLSDTAQSSQLSALSTALSRINNYVASSSTGLSAQMQTMFNDLQSALSNPSSVTSRQVVLSDLQTLVQGFNASAQEIQSENQSVNSAVVSGVSQINSLAQNIAALNQKLAGTGSLPNGQQPNALLDNRDALLQQLSQLVSVSVVKDGSGMDNIFIGNGQALVSGVHAATLATQAAAGNTQALDVTLQGPQGAQVITSSLSGGSLGGQLNYQSNTLGAVQNSIGQLALVLANAMNQQNQLGVDLNGQAGSKIFADINSTTAMASRITAAASNPSPQTYAMGVSITATAQLTASNYTLSFTPPGSTYSLTRASDGQVVAQGQLPATLPATISADGFSINLQSGNYAAGSTFYISPTAQAASQLAMSITTPNQLAFAWPVNASTSTTNQGSGSISVASMNSVSTPAFTTSPGSMTPPVLIRFTSPTTYDVLNNSNPANPVAWSPPLVNQPYTPGVNNTLFSAQSGEFQVSSTGAAAGVAVAGSSNGYPAETLSLNVYNSKTNAVTTTTVSTTANESAQQIAAALNAVSGVQAVADTRAQISAISSNSSFALSLDGQTLSGSTPDALAASINGNGILQQSGIIATSNGTTLSVRSLQGADLSFALAGGAGNALQVTGSSGAAQSLNGSGTATVGGVVNLQMPGSSSVTTTGAGLFTTSPAPASVYQGYTLNLSGVPSTGDTFTVAYNAQGTGDARNGQAMLALQGAALADQGQMTMDGLYGAMVQAVGTQTAQAQNSQSAASSVLQNTTQLVTQVSGVNINEEAVNLIQFQQAYSASAQVINTARTLFNSLLTAVGA